MPAKTLPPTDYLRECFVYNPKTGTLTWRTRPRNHFVDSPHWRQWNTRYAGTSAGCTTNNRRIVSINKSYYWVHRVIWKMTTGNEPPPTIDHRDGQGTNNRRNNLRPATMAEQRGNHRMCANNTSGYRGVRRHRNKWVAYICARYLGIFNTPEEASTVYEAAARKYYGKFYRKVH